MKNNTNWILKGARVIDPINNIDSVQDIYVRDGRIAAAEDMEGVDAQILNLDGYVVTPGLIDIHVHLRQPGKTDAETVATATGTVAYEVLCAATRRAEFVYDEETVFRGR